MGKRFWLIYVVVAGGAGALVWHFAPALGARLQPGVRARICEAVDSVGARWLAPRARPSAGGAGVPDEGARPAARAHVPAVRRTDPPGAKWGVLTGITRVEKLDGKPFGNVAGGRFLKITETVSTATGPKVVGTFMNQQKILHSVRVPAENVLCFTGEPGLLSSNQLASLRAYYELAGEAEKAKKDILDKARANVPYLQEAARALKALRAKEEAVQRLKEAADADALRKMTYEISQLRAQVQELNQKYRDWKSTHNAALPDPEKDPAYRTLVKRRERHAEVLGELVP